VADTSAGFKMLYSYHRRVKQRAILLLLLNCPLLHIDAYTSRVTVQRWVIQALLQTSTGDIISALSQA